MKNGKIEKKNTYIIQLDFVMIIIKKDNLMEKIKKKYFFKKKQITTNKLYFQMNV